MLTCIRIVLLNHNLIFIMAVLTFVAFLSLLGCSFADTDGTSGDSGTSPNGSNTDRSTSHTEVIPGNYLDLSEFRI